jgi:hypothetical protein
LPPASHAAQQLSYWIYKKGVVTGEQMMGGNATNRHNMLIYGL